MVMLQLTDLVYDGDFKVLASLPFPSRCPSCSATEGVVRNGKSTAGHQRYLCSHCRKHWQLQFTYTASEPGTHQKIIDMAMNRRSDITPVHALWALAYNTVLRHFKKL
ncbi:IS1 family transposase, partial [Shigella flexneri]